MVSDFHADAFGDMGDPPRPVAEARHMHDQIDRRDDLLADGVDAHAGIRHPHHHLQAGQAVARAVGVNRGQRAVVAGIHGLHHVERFFAAHLADDDAVRPHAQRVNHQLPDMDRPVAFDVGGPGFHSRYVPAASAVRPHPRW